MLCEIYTRPTCTTTGPMVGRVEVESGEHAKGKLARELLPFGKSFLIESIRTVHSGFDMPALAQIGGRNYLFVPVTAN